VLDAQLLAECDAGVCVTVEESDDGKAAFDVHAHGFGTNGGYAMACQAIVRRQGSASSPGLEYTPVVFQRSVFPLDGEIARVQRCDDEYDGTLHRRRTRLTLLMNPTEYLSLAPAKGNVVIPFTHRDYLTLDGRLAAYARPELNAQGSPSPDTVTLIVFVPGVGDTVYSELRSGSTFAWGPHQAEVVRIVLPATPLIGWVEVALR
jgi:hypothetical protein